MRASIPEKSNEAEQGLHDPAEKTIEAEEKEAQHGCHQHDHDRCHHGFAARWPDDTRGFRADFANELPWTDFRQNVVSNSSAPKMAITG